MIEISDESIRVMTNLIGTKIDVRPQKGLLRNAS
jgi:hypothetical protein